MNRPITTTIILSVLLGFGVSARAQANHVDSILHVIRSLYESGAYVAAEVEARRLLERTPLGDSVRAEAEREIAFSLIAQGRPAMGKEHFLKMLRLQSEVSLDPVLTSPKILTVFQDARESFRIESAAGRDTVTPRPVSAAGGVSYRAFLFPGWEQFHTGRTFHGYLFSGTAAGALSAGVVFDMLRASAREKYMSAVIPSDIEIKYSRYNTLRRSEIIAFSAFALVYIISEIDAILYTESNPPPVVGLATEPSAKVLSFSVRF